MNLFEHAIKNQNLLDFALGNKKYHVVDREYGKHSVIQSYNQSILPLLTDEKKKETINIAIQAMFVEILRAKNLEKEIQTNKLINHLHVYYYLRNENKIKGPDALKDINSELVVYFQKVEQDLVKYQIENDRISHFLNRVIKFGGLTGYSKEIAPPVLFRKRFDFDLIQDEIDYTINVQFYKPEEHIRSFRLLESEIPEKHKELAPLAADMRIDAISYTDREIIPAVHNGNAATDEEQ